jgi:hypothetical protein
MSAGFHNVTNLITGDGAGLEQFPTRNMIIPGKTLLGKQPSLGESRIIDYGPEEDSLVLMLVRNPLDTLLSVHFPRPNQYHVTPGDWIKMSELALKYRNDFRFVYYEGLASEPDKTQERIAEQCRLTIKRPFSECYEHYADLQPGSHGNMNGVRPIDVDSIGKWREGMPYILKMIKENPQLVKLYKKVLKATGLENPWTPTNSSKISKDLSTEMMSLLNSST